MVLAKKTLDQLKISPGERIRLSEHDPAWLPEHVRKLPAEARKSLGKQLLKSSVEGLARAEPPVLRDDEALAALASVGYTDSDATAMQRALTDNAWQIRQGAARGMAGAPADIAVPALSTQARVMRFSSSRTFPGQWYAMSNSRASSARSARRRDSRRAARSRKWSASSSTSASRSRSGGNSNGTTANR